MKALWLAYFLFIIASIIGWVLNIIDIVHSVSGPITALLVARCVGVFFAPLGAVLGWVT